MNVDDFLGMAAASFMESILAIWLKKCFKSSLEILDPQKFRKPLKSMRNGDFVQRTCWICQMSSLNHKHHIRALATSMPCPTQASSGNSQATSHTASIERYSDSDGASYRPTRRSVSSGVTFLRSSLVYSSSRTQKMIAFSSGEALRTVCC